MVQFAAHGTVVGKSAEVSRDAGRAHLSTIPGGVASLFGIGVDGGVVRGVLVPGICHGGLDEGRAARLGCRAIVLRALWVSAPLSGARWDFQHPGHWHSVRNGANRVRWIASRDAMAFCRGRGGRS